MEIFSISAIAVATIAEHTVSNDCMETRYKSTCRFKTCPSTRNCASFEKQQKQKL